MLKSLLKKAPVDEFAKLLVGDIVKRYPPALDREAGKRPSVNRLTRIVEDACSQAAGFRAEHRLGWLGQAKLANAFRWELTEQRYSKDFIDMATEALVVYVSRK
jgi:hypothetical protein